MFSSARFFLIALALLSVNARATDVQISFEPGPIPPTFTGINPWSPTATPDHYSTPECQANAAESDILNSNSPGSVANVQKFFGRCEDRLAHFGLHQLISLSKLDRVKYNFLENPGIREIKITLTDQFPGNKTYTETIRGLLALKADAATPRPWIVIKCGLFCSVSNSTLFRNLLMLGFDESPFNLLVLNSNTGPEFYEDNHRVSVGGLDEGRQTMLVANWLRQESPYKDSVSSLHVIGVSNGGQAALFVSAYNKFFKMPNGKPPVDTVEAFCPVINLQGATEFVFEKSQLKSLFLKEFTDTIKTVYSQVPILQKLVDLNNLPVANDVPLLSANLALDFLTNVPQEWLLPPFTEDRFNSPQDMWANHDFTTMGDKVETPTFIWSPQNDGIVNYADNAGKMVLATANQPNANLGILSTAHGNHCGFALAYGWDTLSTVIRSHILANSPEFLKKRRIVEQPMDLDLPPLNADERIVGQEWIAAPNSDQLTLNYKIWKKNATPTPAIQCTAGPFDAVELCFEKRAITVPIAKLNIPEVAVPANQTMAEVLTRWMNVNLVLLDANHNRITDSVAKPAFLQTVTFAP